jgi:hypothetical protein
VVVVDADPFQECVVVGSVDVEAETADHFGTGARTHCNRRSALQTRVPASEAGWVSGR